MTTLIVLDAGFTKLAEIAQYKSVTFTRSYYGVGGFEVTVDPRARGALALLPERIVFASDAPSRAYWIEEITLTRGKLVAKGTMLKGVAKRRVCVPPLNLPTELWRYAGGAWTKVTDVSTIRAALTDANVYQGFAKPTSPTEGMLFLDLTTMGAVYDWGASAGLGDVVSDLGTAQLRSKYQNFGWDRFTGDAESALLHFASGNLIAPEDAKRRMPNLVAATNLHRGKSLPWQARFDKLDSLLESIGEATELGWDVAPDFANRRFVFGAWQGRDLTQGVPLCLISEKMGNASAVTLKRSLTGSATTCYVGGAGEDENRFILSVGGESEGVSRRELWTECGSVSDADLLRLYAQNKLDAAAPKCTLTAELIDSGACRYGRDYDVGDKVTVRDTFGNSIAARITELSETREGGARTLNATFGDAPVTLGGVMARTQGAAR